jgi:hypothetical protein
MSILKFSCRSQSLRIVKCSLSNVTKKKKKLPLKTGQGVCFHADHDPYVLLTNSVNLLT